MKKISQPELRQRLLHSGILLIFTVAAPLITFTWFDGAVDKTVGIVLSALFAACFLAYQCSEKVRGKGLFILYGEFLLATFATVYSSYLAHFSLEFALLFIIILFGVSMLITEPVFLLSYYAVTLISVGTALYFSGETLIQKEALILILLLFCVISNLNVWVKSREHKRLLKQEEQFELLVGQMQEGFAVHEILLDRRGVPVDYKFLSVNESFERMTGLSRENIVGKRVLEVLPRTEKYWIDLYGKVALTGMPCHYENYSSELDHYYSITAFSPKKYQFAVMVTDITEIKKKQEEVEYLSFHDQLTGIYNRRYYEKVVGELDAKSNLPLAVVMLDVNGLKLTNDAFGHKTGDLLLQKTASILAGQCRPEDVAARIGGDEFVLLMPRSDSMETAAAIRKISGSVADQDFGSVILSVSVGSAIKKDPAEDFVDVFKKAEDEMYRHKLSESLSMHGRMIQLIMNTLHEKNPMEKKHSERVGKLCEEIGTALGFEKDAVSQMRIAGMMHDIGKIGLYENILNKTQRLNVSEREEIERHCEIGYRILSSLSEFSEIARYVLEHHERPDGRGYPRGLKNSEISLQARIIMVADAYDAMTSDRSYRKALGEEAAIRELFRYSGAQFDPDIARLFVEKVLGRKWPDGEAQKSG